MLCRIIITCALLGHVVLSLPAVRAPRHTPQPDEVDSDETRRVLGSSVVTSVSVIMDLGNGSQALFSEPSGNHYGDNNNYNHDSTADNPHSPEKRPVGSPAALMSPDRYEFYTFDESGELVRRLMTLEQIQSLIAGGDDANRIAAIPLDVEIDTAPPQATDPQGQVVASVQQVLAEELLASTKKNGSEPHETEVEVEAEVQELPPPPSSLKPEFDEEMTHVKLSTETIPVTQEPVAASTTQESTETSSHKISVANDTSKVHEKPSSTESAAQEETVIKGDEAMSSTESEASSTAATAMEEDTFHESAESDEVKDHQQSMESSTEGTATSENDEQHIPVHIITDMQETSSPTTSSDTMGEGLDDIKVSVSTEEPIKANTDMAAEVSSEPTMEDLEDDKDTKHPVQEINEDKEESNVKITESPFVTTQNNEEGDEETLSEESDKTEEDSVDDVSDETDITNKIPAVNDNQDESEYKPADDSSSPASVEPSSEANPSEPTVDYQTTPGLSISTPISTDEKYEIDYLMPSDLLEEVLPTDIEGDSQVLPESNFSGIKENVPSSEPTFDENPQEPTAPLEENALAIEEIPASPGLVASLPEMPDSPEPEAAEQESEPVAPDVTQSVVAPQENQPTTSSQDEEEEDAEDETDDDEDLLDQLAESVSSVLSQVSDLVDDDDEFKKKPISTVKPDTTTEKPQEDVIVQSTKQPGTTSGQDEVKGEEAPEVYTESVIPDIRDPTRDSLFQLHHILDNIAPNKDEDNKEDETTKPEDYNVVKTPTPEEMGEGIDNVKESETEAPKDENKTESEESLHGTMSPIATTTEYRLDHPMSTEKTETSPSSVVTSASIEEHTKESEAVRDDETTSSPIEKETEITMAKPSDEEKIELGDTGSFPVLHDKESAEEPHSSSTELPDTTQPTMEGDFEKDSSSGTTVVMEEHKPVEDIKHEITSTLATDQDQKFDTTSMKPIPMEEEDMKIEDETKNESSESEEESIEEEEEEKEIEEETLMKEEIQPAEESSAATSEKIGASEEDEVTESITPTSEIIEESKISQQPPKEEAVTGIPNSKVPDDQILIEEMQNEAEKESDSLLQGEKHAPPDTTKSPSKDEDTNYTTENEKETTEKTLVDENSMNNKHTSVASVDSTTQVAHVEDEVEGIEPFEDSTADKEELKDTSESLLETNTQEESMKTTTVAEVEPVHSSTPETVTNPWTKIPITIQPQITPTPEPIKELPSHSATSVESEKPSFPSASPDELPDPNGLLPLLTEKPDLEDRVQTSEERFSSSTEQPSSTVAAMTTAGAAPSVVVPPLMPSFPPAPQTNLGLEGTSAGTDPDVKRFVDLCNDLAFALYGQVTSSSAASSVPAVRGANGGGVQTRSLVVSPFAIFSLLAMIFLGARGPTSEEMNDLLRLDDMITFNPHLVLQNVTDAVITSPGVSAAAFVRELYSDKTNGKLLEFYKARAKAFYDGHVEEVDFKEVNDVIRRRTNHLVRWQTRGRVPEYLRGSSLRLRSPLAALSANFFEADCQRASSSGTDGEMYFEVPATGRRRRRLVPVPAVVWRGVFLAGHDPGLDATVLELRHGGGEVSTVLVLPGRHGQSMESEDLSGGLTRLENWLINGGKESWSTLLRSALPRGPLEVQLPRFAHRSVLNVTGALSRMGLQHLFQDGKADLGGLDGGLGGKLHLADMIQMTAFGVCADDGSSKRHLETYPSAQRTGRRHTRATQEDPSEAAESEREPKSSWMDELAREEDDSYVFAAAAAARELPLALRPRQARIPRPAIKQQQSRVVLPRLRFDRPFLYFVRHNPSGFILLMGRFNPRLFP